MAPKALRPGDTIAFLSPSTRANHIFPARIVRARTYFESLGFKVKVIYTRLPDRASLVPQPPESDTNAERFDDNTHATPLTNDTESTTQTEPRTDLHQTWTYKEALRARCRELEAAFTDPEVRGVICTIGGTSANEVVRELDYGLISRAALAGTDSTKRTHRDGGSSGVGKIFVGFSDITILHHALYTKTQGAVKGFYGPAVLPCWGEIGGPLGFTADAFWGVVGPDAGISEDPGTAGASGSGTATKTEWHFPRSLKYSDEFLDWLDEETDTTPRTLVDAPRYKWLRKTTTSVRGRLFGGCLPSLVQLVGTEYCPPDFYRDRIMFIETPESNTGVHVAFPVASARAAMFDLRNAGVLDGIVGLVVGRPYRYTAEQRREFEMAVMDATEGLEFPVLVNGDFGHTHPMLTLPLDRMCELDPQGDTFSLLEAAVEI